MIRSVRTMREANKQDNTVTTTPQQTNPGIFQRFENVWCRSIENEFQLDGNFSRLPREI
jgi:hypothetical protein